VHLGIILPNYGPEASPDGVRAVAEAAEELGFHSVWATEHVIVGAEAAATYGRVLEPFATLAWIAGFADRVGLATSITIVPLHNPVQLAKEAATLQELSGGRFTLGVGVGWHEDEFRFMGVEFHARGRRTDEALRLMKALWSGTREFHGDFWSFENATFGPSPRQQPEIWVGGASDRAVSRARKLGDVWHPARTGTPERIREVKAQHPELRVVPRVSARSPAELAAKREALEAAGCEGIVVSFDGRPEQIVAAMRDVVH
jgi:probable F420-dependent oxidoreductase